MPDTLGRFRILEPLGADFIGSRYLAFDPQINRQVVLRTLDPSSEDTAGLVREHFLQEARTAARLSHPNIIKVFGIHTEDPQPFVVLENLDGPSLDLVLAESGPLPVERTVRLIGPVADALEYAHGEGVIHRDVRPGAIIVLSGDQPALTGFVMAKMADVVSAVTRQGLAVGTPGYASPELVTGGNTDLRGDIFSLGAVIYEALTGCQAFVGRNMAETLYRIAHADPEPPSSLVPGLDQRHDRLLLRALAKSPDQRPQTMGELRMELDAWLKPEAGMPDLLADTDEILTELSPLAVDHGGQLPVPDPGMTVAPEGPAPEPVTAADPEPESKGVIGIPRPVVTDQTASAPQAMVAEGSAGAEKGARSSVPAAPVTTGPAPHRERRKSVPVIAAAAAVMLVSLLAAWQFGWFGSGSGERATGGQEELLTTAVEMVDAVDAATGTVSGVEGQLLPGHEAEPPEQAPAELLTISEPPADESAGDSTRSGGDPGESGDSGQPPEKAVAAPPPPTGVLEVASLPWARVTVDGSVKGETPLRIDGLAEGEHRLSLSSAGGMEWSGVVVVRGNRSTYYYHHFREDG